MTIDTVLCVKALAFFNTLAFFPTAKSLRMKGHLPELDDDHGENRMHTDMHTEWKGGCNE